jgi:hypothetical protein
MVRHVIAVRLPQDGFEQALVDLFSGWLRYADSHKQQYGSGIGEDMILGAEWSKIGSALRGLLNGETGRFDCGLLDSLIAKTLRDEGFDPDEL